MKKRKLLAGLGAVAMSLCAMPAYALQADVAAYADLPIEAAINDETSESDPATEAAQNGDEPEAKAQKNENPQSDVDWALFGWIGGGAVVVLISIGVMAKKK